MLRLGAAGMAGEDGRIVLNPESGLSGVERAAVARNEAARLYLREIGGAPGFGITPEQEVRFMGTPYGPRGAGQDLRDTIIGRAVSGDPSSGKLTAIQELIGHLVRGQLETRGKKKANR